MISNDTINFTKFLVIFSSFTNPLSGFLFFHSSITVIYFPIFSTYYSSTHMKQASIKLFLRILILCNLLLIHIHFLFTQLSIRSYGRKRQNILLRLINNLDLIE